MSARCFAITKPGATYRTDARRAGEAMLQITLQARLQTALLIVSTATAGALTGCATGSSSAVKIASPVMLAASKPSGQVMGGQQPVAGVTLQLYTVGNTYGGASTPLGASFQTTASGNFNLPTYTCPSANPMTYLVGTGGTPIGGSPNPNLALMAGLGACNTLASSFVNMNEITTVATVYALAGFMAGPANIGAPASNTTGLVNAFGAINKVVNLATGQASGPALPTGATLPVTEINALGNVLQNCVNSAGGSASDSTDGYTSGTPCGKLFFLTKTAGTTPTDTITATLLLAQNPSLPPGGASSPSYVSRLNSLQASSPAFAPSLSVNAPPSDFTIAITYSAGGLSTPQTVATDASGNIWITNKAANTVTVLNNTGAPVSGTSGYALPAVTAPYGIAIDTAGNGWVTGSTSNTIAKVTPAGSVTSFSGNGLSTPKGIAIDGTGNVWVANSGSAAVSAFSSTGSALTGSPYSGGGISNPTAIAISPK